MGCIAGKTHIPLAEEEQPPEVPPEEPTPQLKQKEAALRKLWLPGSIWTGTISVNGEEAPWEVHVQRNSTPNRITAKRVTNFLQLSFVEAQRVDFCLDWEERKDEDGKHRGWEEVITFEWLDNDYRLFADTLNGSLDVPEKRIEGLVVDNKTKNVGSFDFCRLMANRKLSEQTPIPHQGLNFIHDRKRTNRFMGAVYRTSKNGNFDQERTAGSCVGQELIRK